MDKGKGNGMTDKEPTITTITLVDLPAEYECTCANPGWCPRFKLDQDAYAHGVCSGRGLPGKPCSSEKSLAYRKKWRASLPLRAGEAPGGLKIPSRTEDSPGHVGPSLARKALNATKAAVSATRGFVQGVPLLCPDEVAEERASICRGCEYRDPVTETCTHTNCGCPTSRLLKQGGYRPGKVEISTEKCPIGKWEAWKPDS